MAEYTFHSLSDADFEDLACDLLSAELGMKFQQFAKGRDGGIDLLSGARIHGKTIVQCKHYCRSKYANLKTKLTKEELPKLAKLKPSRFILATSLGLTPQNKEELLTLSTPYCKGVNDIHGMDDFNALLRKHPAVETAHYKLWLTSVPVLQRVLRHGAAVWNAMMVDDIERKMSIYVQTGAFAAAMQILAKHNYCVLSGIPGIGKTTLAQVLVTRLMEDGYELIAVRDDVQEAFDALDLTKNQVVYYDDFLGQSSISERLGKNEDRGIARLLAEARRNKNLKVIFTTREYILEDAKQVYEPISRGDLDMGKCIVKVEDYTRGHRARILYNHVYFSGLPHTYAAALLQAKSYRRIIDHKGYSPRIVEWMTLPERTSEIPPAEYVSRFMQALVDPARIWEHAFDNQLNEDGRAILYGLGSIEGWLGLNELRAIWAQLRNVQSGDKSPIEIKRTFVKAMKQLEGSFTRSTRGYSETAVEFHNPSIKDYVRKRIIEEADVRQLLLRTASYFEQVLCIGSLTTDGRVGPKSSGLIPDDSTLHEAIRRTIQAMPATYEMLRILRDGESRLERKSLDIGARLTEISRLSEAYQSKALFALACDVAAKMVAAGDIAQAATFASIEFLGLVVKQIDQGDLNETVVQPFIEHIDAMLDYTASGLHWWMWRNCVKANKNIFDDAQVDGWAERAAEFCTEQTEVAIDNADTSTELENWYDEIGLAAHAWGVDSIANQRRYQSALDDLRSREDGPDYDGEAWPNSTSRDPMTGGDAEIDRLFDSLNDRARD